MLLVLVVAILALAVPMTAQAFTGPNPAVPQGMRLDQRDRRLERQDVGLAIVFGATTVLVAVGLVELRVRTTARPTPTAA